MPPPATPAAENEIVNRAFQSVTGLTPETATGKAPVAYGGSARGITESADTYKFGAAQPYTPPPPPLAPSPPTPAPRAMQIVPVNPVASIPPPQPLPLPQWLLISVTPMAPKLPTTSSSGIRGSMIHKCAPVTPRERKATITTSIKWS
jgi:hypothetical protein